MFLLETYTSPRRHKLITFMIKDIDGNPRPVNVSGRFHKELRPAVEGDQPYTPSRLEWLVLTLNSRYKRYHGNYTIYYDLDNHNGNKVLVYILHDDLPSEELKRLNQTVQINALSLAKTYGWENWVEVDVRIRQKEHNKE